MLSEDSGANALDALQLGSVCGSSLGYQGDCGITENSERRPAQSLRFMGAIVFECIRDLLAGWQLGGSPSCNDCRLPAYNSVQLVGNTLGRAI